MGTWDRVILTAEVPPDSLRSLLTSSPPPQDKVSFLKGRWWDCPRKDSSSEEQTSCLLTYAGVLVLHREFIQVAVGMALLNGALDPRLASIRLRNGKGYVHMQHLTVHPCFAALALDLCRTRRSVSVTPEQGTHFYLTPSPPHTLEAARTQLRNTLPPRPLLPTQTPLQAVGHRGDHLPPAHPALAPQLGKRCLLLAKVTLML